MRLANLFLLCSLPLAAQEFRANITGLVNDPSGAPVAGAKVLVKDLDRNVTIGTETNESGRYLTRFLPPGAYSVAVEKAGFKRGVREDIRLQAADRLSVNVQLELGTTTDSVTIRDEGALLETETASRRSTVEQKFVQDVAANGRNLYQFLFTLPGVTKTSRYWGSFELYAFGNMNSIMINGGRSGENETLIDGITSTRGSRSASFAPALNAIQEVTVLTNSYDSQYGRFGGGVTSVNLRAGTNQFHGQLFEFLKNDNIQANGYSRNSVGIKQPEFKNNTFGFTIDGPIRIPKLFDGRNKLFFMVSLESLNERNPQTQLWTVPTALEAAGNFSRTVTNDGRQVVMYDPLTTVQSGNAFIRTPFAGNVIPPNRLNPVAAKAVGFYPQPNRISESADNQNNYLFNNSSRNSYNQWLGKMDWVLNSNHRVSWRYGETPWSNFARVQWGNNAAEPSSEFPSTRVSRNWGADWTYTVNPSTVVNLRGGLARYEGFSGNTFGRGFDPTQLGFPSTLVSQFLSLQYPRFNFTGNNLSPLGASQTSGYETQDTYSLQPNLQMIRGRHSYKFGAEFRRYNDNRIRPASASGNYTFARNWTQADPQRADVQSGSPVASFILGYPTSGFVDRNMDPAYRNSYQSYFFQDDWKIRRNLTLNLGLRWDYESPIVERYNRQVRGFAFDQASPIASQVQGLSLKGGLLYAGNKGESREAFNRDQNNWQPRIGVAWQFRPLWVMRGGYGLYYLGQNALGPDTGFSQPTNLIASTDNNLTPAVTLSDPFPRSQFPSGLLQPIGSSQGLATNLGLGVAAQNLNRPLPYSHQFSFGLQRVLPNQWLVDASYAANLTRKLPVGAGLNYIPAATLTSLPVAERAAFFNAQVNNPLRGLLPGSAFNGATVPRQQLLFAYPQYANVNLQSLPIGGQSYHSLQTKATRRYANGLAAQLSYTWSKTLERVTILNNQDVLLGDLNATRPDQRLVEFDTPHTFSAVATYELPFGRNKKLLGGLPKWADAIVGGWNLSAQYMYRSGSPLEFPNAAPLTNRSAALTNAQRDENAVKGGGTKFNPFFDKWFDTTLFPRQAQAPFTLRDFPTRFPDVRSPFLQSWELSGYKQFTIRERVRIQVRADFQNAFNYTYFGRLIATSVTDSRFGQLNPAQDNQPRTVVLVMKVLF